VSILSNVLLITVDDLNYDSVGCFGCQVDDITPNIDKLASEGVRFNNSHVTIAVCQPSRSVLLTGRYPHHNGARGFEEIDASVTTLTQVLHREGFLNGIIGKEDHVAPKEKFFWDEYVQTYCEEEGWGRSPEVYYDKVKQFLTRAREEGKSFFLMANSHDPHRPYVGADDEMFYFGHHTTADRIYTPEEITVPGCLPDLPDVRKELAQYFSSVHRGDQIVGKILQALDDMGYRDDTLVLFLSDNGMALPYAKTNCYLNSTKSPYIMRWPGRIPAGSVSDALVSGIDFTPTVLDVLGIEPIVDADGRSMKHTIMEGAEQYDDIFTLFFKTNNNHITHRALHFPMRCVQNKRFAYIFNAWSDGETTFLNESTEGLTFKAMEKAAETDSYIRHRVDFFKYRVTEELYDYVTDPHAKNNLIEKQEYIRCSAADLKTSDGRKKTMKLDFEYGHGLMSAELPDSTEVFIPGETVADPPCLPQDWDVLYNETVRTLREPLDMPPLRELAAPGKTAVIVIPDIVKGGCQPTSHRKVAIRACLDELYAGGVEKQDVLLMISNGLHPRATVAEMRQILGEELFNEFYYTGQITSHDSEDAANMVDLGHTHRGDPVLMNRYVFECDIPILIGHCQGNPYGGYSGGYKHCTTGITHWRSIASHHVPEVMHRPDFAPVSGHSLMRTKFDEIGMYMEEKMGHRFFCCDAVLDTYSRQIEIWSGYAYEVQKASWPMGNRRTYIPFAKEKYDVMVFGMPQNFHYGDGMGTNPIQMMQALSAQVIRHKRVMKDNCVIICSSICNGYFHDERWPYLRELYEMFQHDHMNILPDMNRYGEYFATNEEYIRKYRFANAFHPFHGFSMMSCGHIAEMNTSAIYIVGAQEPGIARGMGLKTRATFEEALADAKKKLVGSDPRILALPKTFKVGAVHLCMADDDLKTV